MEKVVMVVQYDKKFLDQEGLELLSEMNGWLEGSKIQVLEITDHNKTLGELKKEREDQLNKEVYQSYNYGYVAGEVSGIDKAIKAIASTNKEV